MSVLGTDGFLAPSLAAACPRAATSAVPSTRVLNSLPLFVPFAFFVDREAPSFAAPHKSNSLPPRERVSFAAAMLAFIFRRTILMVVVLWCVVTIAFLLVRSAPGRPFTRERSISPDILAHLMQEANLNGSLWEQYATYTVLILQLATIAGAWRSASGLLPSCQSHEVA